MFYAESDDDEPLAKYLKINQPIANLNEDVLEKILQFLPLCDRIKLERVSHLWQSAVIKSFLNVKSLELNELFPNCQKRKCWQKKLLKLSRKCPNLLHLCFDITTIGRRFAMEQLGNQLNKLESLKLYYNETGDDTITYGRRVRLYLSFVPNLKHLDIDCDAYEEDFLLCLPNSLVSLSLYRFNYDYLLNKRLVETFLRSHPGLKEFKVEWRSFGGDPPISTLLAQYCKDLTHLKIADFYMYSRTIELAFADALQSLTKLEEVEFVNNLNFTDLVLKRLCQTGANLKVLRMGNRPKSPWLYVDSSLSINGLLYLKELKNLKFISLDTLAMEITKEILEAICICEDFNFYSNKGANGWRQFNQAGIDDFIKAIDNHQCLNDPSDCQNLRIEVDLVRQRVWLKKDNFGDNNRLIRVENLNP